MQTRPRVVFFVTLAVFGVVALLLAQTKPTHPEYQIRTVTTMVALSPGTIGEVPTITRVYFGRSDGSYGTRTTEIINGHSCTTTSYTDFQTFEQVTASDCVAMKSTSPLSGVTRHPGPVSTCSQNTSDLSLDGIETIQGIKVERLRADNQSARAMLYLAPDLGCLAVRQRHDWKGPTGEITSTTYDEPVEIKLGTPDSKLFLTPAEYREVVPSERRNALYKYFNGLAQSTSLSQSGRACLRKLNDHEDKIYLGAKKAAEVAKSQKRQSKSMLAQLWSK